MHHYEGNDQENTAFEKGTLPLVGLPHVETMAVMARYNSFFEKAGMSKVAETHGDRTVQEAVKRLEFLGFKAYTLASEETNLNRLKRFFSKATAETVAKVIAQVAVLAKQRSAFSGRT